jgi:hypothetical protein
MLLLSSRRLMIIIMKTITIALIVFLSVGVAFSLPCRSNATHLAWSEDSYLTSTQRELGGSSSSSCAWETIETAQQSAYRYLRQHVVQFDLPNLQSLGFSDGDQQQQDVDGLGDGLVGHSISYAILAKQQHTYTDMLPRYIWNEYVLSFANVNEARSNWRPLLHSKLNALLDTATDDIPTAVRLLNTHMWTLLAPQGQDALNFVSGSTPLIFDPMSILVFGYASCTGFSILFVNALRSVGVPARVVGTPAWQQQREHGNHNWVEVWLDGEWRFLEPSLPPRTFVDSLDDNVDPCQRWFCTADRFANGTTKVYAARSETSDTFYRMAWEWNNQDVPGEDVTSYYERICSECG